jgi:hypothetical protein
MPAPRDVRHPIVTTYLAKKSTSRGSLIHARIYSPDFGVDRRGTGRTSVEAVAAARRGLQRLEKKQP